MLSIKIPLEFIISWHPLTWPELNYGLKKQWLSIHDVELFAKHQWETSTSHDSLEYEMIKASDLPYDVFVKNMEQLCDNSFVENSIKTSWAQIFITWIYTIRNEFSDPLNVLEEIYVELDYPNEMYNLITYNTSFNDVSSIETIYYTWKNKVQEIIGTNNLEKYEL